MSILVRQAGWRARGQTTSAQIFRGLGLALAAIGLGLLGAGRAQAQPDSTKQAEAQASLLKVAVGKAYPDASDKTFPEIQKAIILLSNNDAKTALLWLQSAKEKHPKLPPGELMMASILIAANQPANTVRGVLEDCVKANPADPEAFLLLADQSFSEGRTAEAEALFARAEQLASTFEESAPRKRDCQIRAEAGLAAVAERREQWETAKKYLEAWLAFYGTDKDPASAPAHDRLGRVLFKSASDKIAGGQAALKEFQAAVANDKKSISADLALALLLEEEARTGDKDSEDTKKFHEMAKGEITKAVTQKSGDPSTVLPTLLAAAGWAIDTEQAADAVTYADMALQQDKTSLEAWYLKGVASRLAKDVKTAEDCLNYVYSQQPNNFAAANQLAQVLSEQDTDKDKQKRGLAIAQMNYQVFGNDRQNVAQALESAATFGWCLYLMGPDYRLQAAKVMQAIVNTGVVSADGLYYIARLTNDQEGKTKESVDLLKAALANGRQFVHRQEAEAMLARIDKTPAKPAIGPPPDLAPKKKGAAPSSEVPPSNKSTP
jgi:tetratricopeptide (TPR) repeat protein